MHFGLMLLAIGAACGIRCWIPALYPPTLSQTWSQRWTRSLLSFLVPPLLLLTTAVAVLSMGTQGRMFGLPVGWIGYSLALVFLVLVSLRFLWLLRAGRQAARQLQQYPQHHFNGITGRVVDHTLPFAAQVGIWRSELVISQGLLDRLTPEQLEAVLAHESAHAHHHDTFWFFWLGWLRQIAGYLPHTQALWQELLLLRELRADRWAAQQVDSLLLAESLLLVVQSPVMVAQPFCAAFGDDPTLNRLEERIEALLSQPSETDSGSTIQTVRSWAWLLSIAFLPLLTVLFHT
jgi:Zn-dependent protease with chaperone function